MLQHKSSKSNLTLYSPNSSALTISYTKISLLETTSTNYICIYNQTCKRQWLLYVLPALTLKGARGGVVVKALRYKPAGRGFDSRMCHWNFSVT